MVHLKDTTNGGLRPRGKQKDPEELDWRLDNSEECGSCLLYTSDAADDWLVV